MKNVLFFFCLLATTSQVSAQTPSVKEDEEAIKKVAIAQTDAYIKRDFQANIACYVGSQAYYRMLTPNNNPGAVAFGTDFQKMSKDMKEWMDKKPPTEMQLTAPSDGWVIRINGNMAWVGYNQYNIMVKTGAKIKSKELRVMERIDGQWKISAASSIWDFVHTEYRTPNLEEEVIKALIIKQFESFRDGDFEAWSDFFVHEPYLTWTVTNGGEPGDVLTARGWEELKATMQKVFEAMAKAPKTVNTTKVTRDQWRVEIRGNLAYVNYNQHSENEEKQTIIDTTEIRILEKIKGVWKITTQASLADFKDARPPIRSKY
jgi:hypothetical protein